MFKNSLLLSALLLSSVFAEGAESTFEYALSRKLFEKPDNLFISPYSVKIALEMAEDGAEGETLQEMKSVLGERSPLLSGGGFHSFQALAIDQAFHPLKSYQELIRERFSAEMLKVDFQHKRSQALQVVNGWVLSATEGKIKNLIEPKILHLLRR